MYNSLSKTALENRIGWGVPVPPNTDIILTTENITSVSGRCFNSFHQLAIVENVWNSIVNININNAQFNEYLSQMRKDCVNEVLNKIFNTNPYANAKFNPNWESPNYKTDYSDVILAKQSIFDDSIGYAMAVRIIQLVISTTRSNNTERKNAEFYQIVKTELEGVVNQDGVLIANGVNGQYNTSILNAISILFPIIGKAIGTGGSSGSGGSVLQKPSLKFKSIW